MFRTGRPGPAEHTPHLDDNPSTKTGSVKSKPRYIDAIVSRTTSSIVVTPS